MKITTSQEVKESTYGKELWLSGNIEHLTTGLLGAEIVYTRSPGYNGADAFQVSVEVRKLPLRIFFVGMSLNAKCASFSVNHAFVK